MISTNFKSTYKPFIAGMIVSFVLAGTIFLSAFNPAKAKAPEAQTTQSDWIYVEGGKVYYFEKSGTLVYKQLKDAHMRYNY